MDWMSNPEIWIALVTLTVLELVLGIDNIIFISILAGKLPREQQGRARVVGLGLAMFTRILLLLSLAWLAHLSSALFSIGEREVSARDIILLVGGLFLLAKSTREIHEKLEGQEEEAQQTGGGPTFGAVIAQIIVLDIVFSIDSVITAIGIAQQIEVMAAAIIIAVFVMMVAINPIAEFIDRHKEIKIVALSFLLLVGFVLVADAAGNPIPRGYLYFALGFASLVQVLILWAQSSDRQLDELAKHEEHRQQREA